MLYMYVSFAKIPVTAVESENRIVDFARWRHFVMVALWNRADHYIFALWFLSYFFLA